MAEDNVMFAYRGGEIPMSDEHPYFTRLIGKRIVPPPPTEYNDVWPCEKPMQFETFIIGNDENGDPVTHTCDPKAVSNYFGANPGEPDYLTRVFFDSC